MGLWILQTVLRYNLREKEDLLLSSHSAEGRFLDIIKNERGGPMPSTCVHFRPLLSTYTMDPFISDLPPCASFGTDEHMLAILSFKHYILLIYSVFCACASKCGYGGQRTTYRSQEVSLSGPGN